MSTLSRARQALDAAIVSWRSHGALHKKPQVISRHESGYQPWFRESLDAARQYSGTLRAEELDRLTCIVHYLGYVTNEAGQRVAKVELQADAHETIMTLLHEYGVFEGFQSKLLEDVTQSRVPGGFLVIAFDESDPSNRKAAVSQILKADPDVDLDPQRIQQLADVDEVGRRPGAKFEIR